MHHRVPLIKSLFRSHHFVIQFANQADAAVVRRFPAKSVGVPETKWRRWRQYQFEKSITMHRDAICASPGEAGGDGKRGRQIAYCLSGDNRLVIGRVPTERGAGGGVMHAR